MGERNYYLNATLTACIALNLSTHCHLASYLLSIAAAWKTCVRIVVKRPEDKFSVSQLSISPKVLTLMSSIFFVASPLL